MLYYIIHCVLIFTTRKNDQWKRWVQAIIQESGAPIQHLFQYKNVIELYFYEIHIFNIQNGKYFSV
jgi:hypothetical protein